MQNDENVVNRQDNIISTAYVHDNPWITVFLFSFHCIWGTKHNQHFPLPAGDYLPRMIRVFLLSISFLSFLYFLVLLIAALNFLFYFHCSFLRLKKKWCGRGCSDVSGWGESRFLDNMMTEIGPGTFIARKKGKRCSWKEQSIFFFSWEEITRKSFDALTLQLKGTSLAGWRPKA